MFWRDRNTARSGGPVTMAEQQQQQQQRPPLAGGDDASSSDTATTTGASGPRGRAKKAPSPAQPQRGPPPPRRPSAEEMVEYYSRKGLDRQAAAERVIEDLQKALTIAVARAPGRPGDELRRSGGPTVSGTLDALAGRLSAVEAKVDDKPDVRGVFVAGVAAGGFLQAMPHVFRGLSQIGRSVKEMVAPRP